MVEGTGVEQNLNDFTNKFPHDEIDTIAMMHDINYSLATNIDEELEADLLDCCAHHLHQELGGVRVRTSVCVRHLPSPAPTPK